MPKFYLDDKEIEFKSGQTIIEAAKDNGIEIPHFCWHPSLSVSGNCRMCLVEIEKISKPMIACSTLATEGMKAFVNSPKAIKARENVMEFLLINHPLDCPICDEAGECKLQDYAYSHSTGESRFTEIKVHKNKRVQLGPFVMLDEERCIACSRCIRFSTEIANQEQLTFVNRGDRVTISTFPGKSFDNPYSLNVVDICPVGALTNRDFRFKARVWDMSANPTICPGCSRGCNIDLWVRNNQILRVTPRLNDEVNSYWICDNGRLNFFKFVNGEDRIDSPFIKENGNLIKSDWQNAFQNLSTELKKYKTNEIACIGSPYSTLEDNYLLSKFAKENLKTNHLYYLENIIENDEDDILIKKDKTPNTYSLKLLSYQLLDKNNFDNFKENILQKRIKVLFVADEDLVRINPEWINILKQLEMLVLFISNVNNTFQFANYVFPASTYSEKNGIFINFEGRLQRLKPAVITGEMDRSLDGMNMSRLDKFGTEFDKWGKAKKIDSKSLWKIIKLISNNLDKKYDYQTSEDIFLEITQKYNQLKNLNYEKIGDRGLKIN